MRDYNRGNRSGGGNHRGGGFRGGNRSGGFRGGNHGGGGGGFRGRDSGPREMHSAVCDECGKNCEVPFRPTGNKPIFCSECFETKDGGNRGRGGRDGNDSSREVLEKINALDKKVSKMLKLIESHHNEISAEETVEATPVEDPAEVEVSVKNEEIEVKEETPEEA